MLRGQLGVRRRLVGDEGWLNVRRVVVDRAAPWFGRCPDKIRALELPYSPTTPIR
jgi:hypothetical protein